MKTLTLIISLLIIIVSSANAQWTGEYEYSAEGGLIVYTIKIYEDNTATYFGEGIQTYFGVNMNWQENGDKLDLFYKSTYEGSFFPANWINKDEPYAVMFRKNGKTYIKFPQLKGNDNTYKLKKIN